MRLGRFIVSKELIEGKHRVDFARTLATIEFVPTNVSQPQVIDGAYRPGSYLYIGISPRFEYVPEGHLIPYYDVTTFASGKVEVERI
jgi:hypothetical protein